MDLKTYFYVCWLAIDALQLKFLTFMIESGVRNCNRDLVLILTVLFLYLEINIDHEVKRLNFFSTFFNSILS